MNMGGFELVRTRSLLLWLRRLWGLAATADRGLLRYKIRHSISNPRLRAVYRFGKKFVFEIFFLLL